MIFIAIGANLNHPEHGSPRATCEAALSALHAETGVAVSRVSRWYESAPVPVSDQPWFINAVAEVETELAPGALMALLHTIEARFGRVRGEKNAPRTLDLDLLDYHGQVLSESAAPDLPHAIHSGAPDLPHPRMCERAFVLLPLGELAPDWRHPETGVGIAALIVALDTTATIRPVA